MQLAQQFSPQLGKRAACDALAVSRASFYRAAKPKTAAKEQPPPPRTLTEAERQTILAQLNSSRFADKSPREVYASLLDEGTYLCSISTIYRILGDYQQVRERRNQLSHPQYRKPELLATAPNQVWSWDITKLLGPVKWSYFYLYVIMDIFSRYVVGWMVAECESAELAKQLIAHTCLNQNIALGQLTLHADRGSSMRSKPVAALLADLGVTKTHSRPYTSNDNPFSEAQFKTLKYRPDFPANFGSLADARAFTRPFFHWYNTEHHHSGIALLTPEIVHYGLAQDFIDARQQTLLAAYSAHPERFVKHIPKPLQLPPAVWINPPARQFLNVDSLH